MSRHEASFRAGAVPSRRLLAGIAGVALAVAIPNAVYAVGLIGADSALLAQNSFAAAFTPASGDPRVAQIVAERSANASSFMQFTPAGSNDSGSRRVTVAVRVDHEAARAISGRSGDGAGEDQSGLRIAPTRYNLGIARGYQSFAKPAETAPAVAISKSDMPDLASFVPSPGAKEKPSRFAARVQLEEGSPAQAAPQLSRRSGQQTADQTLDVAGSYRLTRNLDVTAGVRYAQDRARVAPIADSAKQDNQAVYVGTQFRF